MGQNLVTARADNNVVKLQVGFDELVRISQFFLHSVVARLQPFNIRITRPAGCPSGSCGLKYLPDLIKTCDKVFVHPDFALPIENVRIQVIPLLTRQTKHSLTVGYADQTLGLQSTNGFAQNGSTNLKLVAQIRLGGEHERTLGLRANDMQRQVVHHPRRELLGGWLTWCDRS